MATGGESPTLLMGSKLPTIICLDKIHGGDSDGDEDQQSPNEKGAPTKTRTRSLNILRFACHFHKRSPSRYCSTACDGRYKKCEGPGWECLASIKKHIQRRHLVTSRSYPRDLNMESDREQLQPNLDQQLHREQSNSYDGVDTSQWQSICRLVINERCYDVSIWFAIWHILFPGVRAPENPWHESRTHNPLHQLPAQTIQSNHLSVPSRTNSNHSESDDWTSTSATPSSVSNNLNADWISTTSLSSSDGRDESVDVGTDISGLSCFNFHIPDSYCQDNFLFPSPITTEHFVTPITWVDSAIWFDPDEAAPPVELSQLSNDSSEVPTDGPKTLGSENCDYHSLQINTYAGSSVNHHPSDGLDWDYNFQGQDNASTTSHESPDAPNQLAPPEHGILKSNSKPRITVCEDADDMNMQFGPSDETPRPGIAFSWTADDSESREDFEHRILRTALASDPDLFARSLSLFQAEWERRRIPQSPGVVSCVTSGESIQGGGLTESTQSSPSQNESGTQSRKHKLADGDPNDNENENGEDGDEQHSNPKRPYVGPRFACPFHKMNPLVYDRKSTAGASEQVKWAKCGVYGSIKFKDLIADHLLKVHRIFDCTQCGASFDVMEAALSHAYACPRLGQPQIQGPIREGISMTQVGEIEKIRGDRKNKLTERDKWMKVWKLLFPHKEEPKSPYFGEDDAPTPVPISTPEIESILRTFRNFVQADTRDGLMTIDHQTYARLEDRLRMAVVTTRSRAASGGMPTPSGSSMASSSPFSGNERNSHVGTPFSRNRDLSRVAMADAFPSSPNSSSRLNFGIAETPSDRVSIPPPSPHHSGVVNRRPSTSEPNSWTSAPLLDSSPVTGSQPSDAFAGFAQEPQALPSENQQWHQNASPQTSDYMTENASSQQLYVQHQSNASQIPSFPMSNQQPSPDALAQHIRRLQAEIETLSQLVIPTQADPVDVRAPMPGPQQHSMVYPSTHARPIVRSSVNAMNRFRHTDKRSSSPMRVQATSTPAHSVTPQQKHISNKSGKRNQIQQSHSSHVQQRQYKQPRTETHHQQYYQPVPSDAMHCVSHGTLDDNFYGTPATHGYSNPSNKSDWDEMLSMGETSAQCQQIGMPSDATPDDYMSNEYMTRLLDPDVPVEDTTDMNAESASDNAGGSQPFAN